MFYFACVCTHVCVACWRVQCEVSVCVPEVGEGFLSIVDTQFRGMCCVCICAYVHVCELESEASVRVLAVAISCLEVYMY